MDNIRQNNDRESLIYNFEVVENVIEHIEKDLNDLECLDNEKEELEKRKNDKKNEITNTQLTLFLLGIPFGLLMPIIWRSEFKGYSFWQVIFWWITYYTFFFGLVNRVYWLLTRKKREMLAQKYYDENIVGINARVNKLMKEMEDYFELEKVKWARAYIPEEYFDSESINTMLKYLRTGRADTLKEVFNLYEDVLHKQRVENMQSMQLHMQQEQLRCSDEIIAQSELQSEYMQQIQKNTRATARAAKVNAFISIVNGHSQKKNLKKIVKNTK